MNLIEECEGCAGDKCTPCPAAPAKKVCANCAYRELDRVDGRPGCVSPKVRYPEFVKYFVQKQEGCPSFLEHPDWVERR